MSAYVEIRGLAYTATLSGEQAEGYLAALEWRQARGRYTLEEAALALQDSVGADGMAIAEQLELAAFAGNLPTYKAKSETRLRYEKAGAKRVYLADEAYWEDLNRWLDENEPRIKWQFPKPGQSAKARQSPIDSGKNWMDVAREIANECWKKDKEMDLHPSLNDISEAVAKELRERGVYGPGGPLSSGTVKRMALQGDKWWQKKMR